MVQCWQAGHDGASAGAGLAGARSRAVGRRRRADPEIHSSSCELAVDRSRAVRHRREFAALALPIQIGAKKEGKVVSSAPQRVNASLICL